MAAKAAPDGYTLFLGGVGSHAINPNLNEHLPYDPIKDFAPIVLLASAPLILGGPKTLWFTPIVYDRFYQAFNWNQGSAYALILLLTCIVFVLLVMRLFKVSFSEIAR